MSSHRPPKRPKPTAAVDPVELSGEAIAALRATLSCPSLMMRADSRWAIGRQPNATTLVSTDAPADTPTQARMHIRQAIAQELKNRGASLSSADEAHLLDLSQPPRLARHQISISHCQIAGGFCTAEDVLSIGFDLEELSRIKEPVVSRISDPEERQAAPSLAHLWLAKEASYKALLGPDQPRVMAMIKISQWRSLAAPQGTESYWSFTADLLATDSSRRHIAGRGAILCISALGFGFFVRPLN